VITAGLLRAAGVTVTGVDIDELDPALTAGPRHGRDLAQAASRIGFTAAGTAEPGQMPVRIAYLSTQAASPCHRPGLCARFVPGRRADLYHRCRPSGRRGCETVV